MDVTAGKQALSKDQDPAIPSSGAVRRNGFLWIPALAVVRRELKGVIQFLEVFIAFAEIFPVSLPRTMA